MLNDKYLLSGVSRHEDARKPPTERSGYIFLVRHGRSEWNGCKKVTGQLNPPLSPEGIAQAQCLARILRDRRLGGIYTSTLERAIATARPTARLHNLSIHTCDGLKEIHL